MQGAQTVSHFQRAVLKIGNYLIILAVVLVATIIAFAIFRGDPILTTLQFALVLTVAAIPVAMPTVLSVTMAVGARLLAKKKAIVTRLEAIEELAGVDVLCADKTGTLTQNKLTLGDPFSVNKIPAEQVILDAALASRADNNDTIDLAVLGGLKNDQALKSYKVGHFQPFDPVHKRTEAAVTGPDGKTFKVTKGAPQVILALSANAAEVKPAVDKAVNEFAARGFRSLGVARAEGDGKWQFLGVLPLFDPPREDAKSTIATAQHMGVKVKMVTGDALAIARETAKTLGMGINILDASSLGDEKQQTTMAVAKAIEKADGFAQVFPEHKFHIVADLQKCGHIVGMTGDGVNDAPALKKADCGIAVSGATDAARAAAAIVLMTPGLSVIIDAIKESRRIFQRMNSYAIYRIAETLRVLLFMTSGDPGLQLLSVDGGDDRDAGVAQRWRHSVYCLRQRSLQGRARGLEHAPGAGDRHGPGHHWRRGRVWPVLSWRARLSPRPRAYPDADVPEVVRGRTSDDFPDAHPRPVLVHTPSADFMDSGARHADGGDPDCGLWVVYDTPRLELGTVRLGLCSDLVSRE